MVFSLLCLEGSWSVTLEHVEYCVADVEHMIHRPDYSQLPKDMQVVFLVSGGRDSTAMVLEAYRLGIRGLMAFNETGYNREGAYAVLEQLQETTGFPLHVVRYTGEKPRGEILREAFLKIPEALEILHRTGKYRRNIFACCSMLKKQPMTRFIRGLGRDCVLVLGIKGSDGAINRTYRMRQLREQGVFYRRHQRNGLLYYYPLRDCTDRDVDAILAEWNMAHIQSTGCRICPLFVLFPKWRKKEPKTWQRSVHFARQLGIDCDAVYQTELEWFS